MLFGFLIKWVLWWRVSPLGRCHPSRQWCHLCLLAACLSGDSPLPVLSHPSSSLPGTIFFFSPQRHPNGANPVYMSQSIFRLKHLFLEKKRGYPLRWSYLDNLITRLFHISLHSTCLHLKTQSSLDICWIPFQMTQYMELFLGFQTYKLPLKNSKATVLIMTCFRIPQLVVYLAAHLYDFNKTYKISQVSGTDDALI